MKRFFAAVAALAIGTQAPTFAQTSGNPVTDKAAQTKPAPASATQEQAKAKPTPTTPTETSTSTSTPKPSYDANQYWWHAQSGWQVWDEQLDSISQWQAVYYWDTDWNGWRYYYPNQPKAQSTSQGYSSNYYSPQQGYYAPQGNWGGYYQQPMMMPAFGGFGGFGGGFGGGGCSS